MCLLTFLFALASLLWYLQIQLLADLNLKKTPQLVELVEDSSVMKFCLLMSICPIELIHWDVMCPYLIMHLIYLQDVEELMGLAPEKVLLKWMNFHLKKAGYKKPVTNFSSDLKVFCFLSCGSCSTLDMLWLRQLYVIALSSIYCTISPHNFIVFIYLYIFLLAIGMMINRVCVAEQLNVNLRCLYWFLLLMNLQDGEAYAYLLNVLAPEHCSPATLDSKDASERAKLVLDHAEKMDCKRYLTPKDIVEGSANLNLAFVAQIFHQRWKWTKLLHIDVLCNSSMHSFYFFPFWFGWKHLQKFIFLEHDMLLKFLE